jgi:hypothetical protein
VNEVILALALVLAFASPPVTPTIPEAPVQSATQRIIVRCTATELESLRTELAARWPGAEVLPYGPAAFEATAGKPFAYLEVTGEAVGDSPVAITLVLSDGRAYLRRVVPSDAGRARVLAVAIANLLGAVEDEDVPPDRTGVAVPTPEEIAVEPEPEPEPAPEVVDPQPEPEPEPTPTITREPERRTRTRAPGRGGWRVGMRAGPALLVGLAPQTRRGSPAFGGVLGVDARAPRGLAFGLGVRITGDGARNFSLVRTRIAPWVGYVARTGALEITAGAGPTLEPWRIRRDGDGLTLASPDGRGWTVLYGAMIGAGLGWWTDLRTRTPSSLRVGADLELAMSSQASGKAVLIRAARSGPELFALGGFELGIAVSATWWFDVRPRRGTPARP